MSGRWLARAVPRGYERPLCQRRSIHRRLLSASAAPQRRSRPSSALVALASVSVGLAVLRSTSTSERPRPDGRSSARAFLQRQQLAAQAAWLLSSAFVAHTAPTRSDERREDDRPTARRLLWWAAMQAAWRERETQSGGRALDTMIHTLVRLLLPPTEADATTREQRDVDRRELVRLLGGVIDLLTAFAATEQAQDPDLLRGIVRAIAEAMDAAGSEQPPRISLVPLGQLIAHVLAMECSAPAPVARDVFELWMTMMRRWIDSGIQSRASGLQLAGATCLRAMSSYPSSRHALSNSSETMESLFHLARQLHEDQVKSEQLAAHLATDRRRSRKRHNGTVDDSLIYQLERGLIGKHVSRAFRNVCTSFHRGHTAMSEAFTASSTISLQSKRELPMSRVFQASSDLTDLPVIGADEYESSTEFGWIDILTQWACSSDPNIRENAIESLVHLVEEEPDSEKETDRAQDIQKREHILQAWLTHVLQHVRNISGGEELLAVKEVERIAQLSDELTPGNEKILFNPAVVDAGTSALAVLAEHHHRELLQSGVVPLMTLLAVTRNSKSIDFSASCAQVISNLVAACCKCLAADVSSPVHGALVSATIASPSSKWWLWRSLVADSNDVECTMATYPSGQRFLRMLRDEWDKRGDPMERSEFFRVLSNFKAFRELSQTGRVTVPVYSEGVFPVVPKKETSEEMDDADDTSRFKHAASNSVDVVFVHGLRGHAFGTWRTDMNDSIDSKDNAVWPDEFLLPDLQADGIDARVITLGYEAGMVSWSSPWPSLTLEERARVMLRALQDARIGEPSDPDDCTSAPRPVIFVTHSMGGLLVKKMLALSAGVNTSKEPSTMTADATEESVGSTGSLAKSTRGVVFLAVPHFGSDLARGVRSEAVRTLLRTHPALQDLCASHDQRLEKLNAAFSALGIGCLSIAEELPAPLGLGLSALVVKPDSANPGMGEFLVLPGSDHMTICKAKTRDDPMFERVHEYILRCLSLAASMDETTDASLPTRSVNDAYNVQKQISKGAFGDVRRRSDHATVCIKQVDVRFLSPSQRAGCLAEVELLRSLPRHPHIVTLLDAFWDQETAGLRADRLVLVLEYADAGDVAELVRAEHKSLVDLDVKLDLFAQIVLGLEFLHSRHVLHRDLKPQNVFRFRDGRAVIGDFGTCKALESTVAMAQTLVGSPLYMSPETLEDEPYGLAADVWSLGCLLFELLTGRPSFAASSYPAVVLKITTASFDAHALDTVDCPVAIRDLVVRMLRRDPAERPTIQEIAAIDALQPLLERVRSRFPHERGALSSPETERVGTGETLDTVSRPEQLPPPGDTSPGLLLLPPPPPVAVQKRASPANEPGDRAIPRVVFPTSRASLAHVLSTERLLRHRQQVQPTRFLSCVPQLDSAAPVGDTKDAHPLPLPRSSAPPKRQQPARARMRMRTPLPADNMMIVGTKLSSSRAANSKS
ncbi:hypothetical protein P43SY_010553 [Pythium insidiosum]|uniref:non-specific serine/threonine protein kinase n=1 Tax=Pythium insidiosum TaxID=114742 RepID=A0AAD5LIK4_PYTIN|nr:hypothetical protein P43SY_010553 [Pythium insidiosum]